MSLRACTTFPGSKKWSWRISGQYTAPSLDLCALILTLDPQCTPLREGAEALGELANLSLARGDLCFPAATTQKSRAQPASPQHCSSEWGNALGSQCLRQRCLPSPKPQTQARKDPRESSRSHEVASAPETQCQAAPGWAVHVDPVNSTVHKFNKHEPNHIPNTKLREGQEHPGSQRIAFPSPPVPC